MLIKVLIKIQKKDMLIFGRGSYEHRNKNGTCKPQIIPTITMELCDDKNVIKVSATGDEKPYSAEDKNNGYRSTAQQPKDSEY